MNQSPSVEVNHLSFQLSNQNILHNLSFKLSPGSRCLLVGANGAGKSTLLRILGGRHLHENNAVKVLGHHAFHDTRQLNHQRLYVDPNWGLRTVAFAGCGVAYQADIPVKDMMSNLQQEFPERKNTLLKLLEIDPDWRMHLLSDGQRRRVQLFLALLRPFQVLFLDEVVAVLDILCRKRLLQFLTQESTDRKATIIFATHVFDGLEEWTTHLLWLKKYPLAGTLGYFGTLSQAPHYQKNNLLHTIETILTQEQSLTSDKEKEASEHALRLTLQHANPQLSGGGFSSGRMLSTVTRDGGGFQPGRMYNYW